jgi:hypothetical protein
MFDNRNGFLLYDPPPAGADRSVYAESRHIDADTFNKIVRGELPVRWPQDSKGAAKARKQAQGAAMGRPAGAPAGAPAGVPAPRPVTPQAAAVIPGGQPAPGQVAGAMVPTPPGAAPAAPVTQGW